MFKDNQNINLVIVFVCMRETVPYIPNVLRLYRLRTRIAISFKIQFQFQQFTMWSCNKEQIKTNFLTEVMNIEKAKGSVRLGSDIMANTTVVMNLIVKVPTID